MSNQKTGKENRPERGAGPKLSVVLTGIGTIAALIIGLLLLVGSDMIYNMLESFMGSDGLSILEFALGMFGTGLDEILRIVAILFLVCGAWCLIFWIVCLKSKFHRVRDIICTILGRIPIFILAMAVFRMIYQPFNILGTLTVVLFIWTFLTIFLSIFGWRKNRRR